MATQRTQAKQFLQLGHTMLSQHLLAYWIFRWFEAVCTECALSEQLKSISKSCPTNKCHIDIWVIPLLYDDCCYIAIVELVYSIQF